MRRSTALMARLKAQQAQGASLCFDNCIGGYFSIDPKYTLKVEGNTETEVVPNPNVCPLGSLDRCNAWAVLGDDGVMDSSEVAQMLEPNKTYTVSFEAECISKPDDTTICSGCYDYETGENISCGTLNRILSDNALGFALVHESAEDSSYGFNVGIPDSADYPTIALYVNHELQVGEKYRGVMTFTTPDSLEGYRLYALTNQFYFNHMIVSYPEVHCSTATLTNIQIEEGDRATTYVPFGAPDGSKNIYVTAGSAIICGQNLVSRSNPNLFPLESSTLDGISSWAVLGDDGVMDSSEVAQMLEPNKTYTVSFEAECISKPDDTTICSGCWNDEAGTDVPCGTVNRYSSDNALGFALVHESAEDWSGGLGLGIPDSTDYPTIALYVNHELQVGEKYRGVMTFTTPDSLEGYRLYALTNQFYEEHYSGPRYPTNSTVIFTNVKIEEGSKATPYVPYGTNTNEPSSDAYIKSRITVPCDLAAGDAWYPILGYVVRHNGSMEEYLPHPLIAMCGNVDIIQEARGVKAQLSATLLSV